NFQTNPAWSINEISLFDHKLVNATDGLNSRRAVMDQVTAERTSRAARRRIFTDAHTHKEPRMHASCVNLYRCALKGIVTGAAAKDITLLKDVVEQILIRATV